MKLSQFNQQTLQRQADSFLSSLSTFLEKYPQLKSQIKNYPIDHLAIKSFATEDYELFVESLKEYSQSLSYTPMDNRRIATAMLKKPIIFSELGKTNILEVIEPKPEKSEKTSARFDHIEIRNPNFEKIEKILKKLNIPYKPYANPKHKALVIEINDEEQEIKFTDGNLFEIVQKELTEGTAQKL